MSKNNKTNEKTAVVMSKAMAFLKHNIYYILMGVCILALATVITIAAIVNSNKEKTQVEQNDPVAETPGPVVDNGNNDNPNIENKDTNPKVTVDPVEEKFLMIAPLDVYTEGQGFSNTELVWNATQKYWATHEGMDFKGAEGSNVKCVYDGTVKSVSTDKFDGTVVTISHKNGYETVYKLLDNVQIKAGDSIKKGQVIGTLSSSALSETAEGPHLHFELYKDGEKINPIDFLLTGDK